jgi:lysine 2,3-aminomutase
MREHNKKRIKEKISAFSKGDLEAWGSYEWQLKHVIRDIDTFERIMDIEFEKTERERLELTLKKFPLSITPYYASLIDTRDFRNDPI